MFINQYLLITINANYFFILFGINIDQFVYTAFLSLTDNIIIEFSQD